MERTACLVVLNLQSTPWKRSSRMNKLLASTAVCLVLGTAAFAQSPNNSSTNSSSQPQSSRDTDRDKDTKRQRTPDAAQNRPSDSTQSSQDRPSDSKQNQSSQNRAPD